LPQTELLKIKAEALVKLSNTCSTSER
jgi:hypothetical protein